MVKIEKSLNNQDSPQARKELAAAVAKRILAKPAGRPNRKEFLRFLDELGNKMEERGLTEEILQDILNDED